MPLTLFKSLLTLSGWSWIWCTMGECQCENREPSGFLGTPVWGWDTLPSVVLQMVYLHVFSLSSSTRTPNPLLMASSNQQRAMLNLEVPSSLQRRGIWGVCFPVSRYLINSKLIKINQNKAFFLLNFHRRKCQYVLICRMTRGLTPVWTYISSSGFYYFPEWQLFPLCNTAMGNCRLKAGLITSQQILVLFFSFLLCISSTLKVMIHYVKFMSVKYYNVRTGTMGQW